MNLEKLSTMPDWPALMDRDTAILYLGGKRGTLKALEDGGYLTRFSDGPKNTAFRRVDIDTALSAWLLKNEKKAS